MPCSVTFVVNCLHMKGVYMWHDTVSNFKGFTVPMHGHCIRYADTLSLWYAHTGWNTSACRLYRHHNYWLFSLVTFMWAWLQQLQNSDFTRNCICVSLLYVSNNHISFSLLILQLVSFHFVLGCEWTLHAHITFLSSYHVYALGGEFSLNYYAMSNHHISLFSPPIFIRRWVFIELFDVLCYE